MPGDGVGVHAKARKTPSGGNRHAIVPWLFALALLVSLYRGEAQSPSAFSYQGHLLVAGLPANGVYDFRFSAATDAGGVNPAGNPFITNAIPVNNGLFSVGIDFGSEVFTGTALWLKTEVKTNGAPSYVALAPLTYIAPTPYALYAPSAGTAELANGLNGTLPAAQLPSVAVTNDEAGVNLSGSFTGNGRTLTNLQIANLTTPVGVPNTNSLILSGFSFGDTNNGVPGVGTNLNLSFLNGTWTLGANGAYHLGTNGIFYEPTGNNAFGSPCWFVTNAAEKDISTPVTVAAFFSIPAGPAVSSPNPVYDGISGLSIAGSVVWPTNVVMASLNPNASNFFFTGQFNSPVVVIQGGNQLTISPTASGGAVISTSDGSSIVVSNGTLQVPNLQTSGLLVTNLPPSGNTIAQQLMPACPLTVNSYSHWQPLPGNPPNENGLTNEMLQMSTNGMVAAGYNWYFLDDGWGARDSQNNLVWQTNNFPHGLPWLIGFAHSLGIKMSVYLALFPGVVGNYTTSANLATDATTIALWNADYVSVDTIGLPINTPQQGDEQVRIEYNAWMAALQARSAVGLSEVMGMSANPFTTVIIPDAYNATPLFQACENIQTGNSFPSTIQGMLEEALAWHNSTAWQTHRGSYLNWETDYPTWDTNFIGARFIMTAIYSAMVNHFPEELASVPMLTNSEVIAVIQDPGCVAGNLCWSNNLQEMWAKPLGGVQGQSYAVGLFNFSATNAALPISWTNFSNVTSSQTFLVRDIVNHTNIGVLSNSMSFCVATGTGTMLTFTFCDANGNRVPVYR